MSGQWKVVAKLTFKGKRFEDNALDSSALSEIIQFQNMVTETAKTQWKAANPDRERVPWHFEEQMRLCLRRIESGSTVVPLDVYVPATDELPFGESEPPKEVTRAVNTIHRVYRALEKGETLPDDFPKSLIQTYANWGKTIAADDECIEISGNGEEPVRVTTKTRDRWNVFSEMKYEGQADITGEVLEADVRNNRFQIWPDERTYVTVVFTTEQETFVTEALKEHRTRRVHVKGKGEFTPQGVLDRVRQVEDMQLLPVGEPGYDTSARPIEDILMELAQEVPEEEWKRLPSDLTDNLDHYLYGSRKR